ncbi:P-loop containing nucleoside triphosphate hydrolase protein [Dacryopinax primogenitus]|uniref:p-loop containing nucleoside triphosphate hydrolase protein n=1 Tax=Dacryopinax primogenitus (strain DJM 731) TaxID=1858805 RepID=M5G4I2_DACPD|nr:P-loop containing nucleoside triphosphate hydrolase protein [Dacryopinax primogenitus]EJU03604.1 P-loop containing nucleoside triphosphate hydrolase protein [Dacryopinax primogenitus]
MDLIINSTTGALKNLVQVQSGNTMDAVKDFAKLAILGTTVETARRLASSGWKQFIESFFLTAHFTQDDYPYDWLLHWLSKQPAWGRSREFEITTRTGLRLGVVNNNKSEVDDEDDDEEDKALISGGRAKKVSFMPSHDTTHTIFFAGHWLHITRGRTQGTDWYANAETLKISVIARNNDVIKQLVLQAKKDYERDAEHRVHIFLADIYGRWGWNGARQKRPLSSIVLEPGIKEMLLDDAKDFLRSEDWYADRGIPFRRGYLLHGVPGSGKTSLIHALAGELGLDIYVVTLSSKGMNDSSLASLMGRVPSRCIVLLEDLDAAFTRSTSRDDTATGTPTSTTTKTTADDGNTLSLSGLLNSLDGVAATEGRLLFATTNHIERLDPALSRPGRMDVWVDFKNATSWQAERLFKNFFPYVGQKLEDGSVATIETLSLRPPTSRKKSKASARAAPVLTEAEMTELASTFAQRVPDGEMSVAALQGYLLKNKSRPKEAVAEVEAWVKKERETKAKLKKEKEEKEAKEKEEKDAKEKEEKEKTAAAEKAAVKEKRKLLRAKEKRRAARRVAGEVPTDSSDSEFDKPTPSTSASKAEKTPPASSDKPVEGTEAHAEALVAALVDAATTKSDIKDAPTELTSGASTPVMVDKPVTDGDLSCEEAEKQTDSKGPAPDATSSVPETSTSETSTSSTS